jgi:hypothetical protein
VPSSWTEGGIQNVLDKADKLFERYFYDEDDETVEERIRI